MDVAEEVEAIRDGAAVIARPEVKTLALTGPDRVRFLNGMVSNDVAQLQPGQGVPAVKTSNKGRVEALVRVRASEDALAIDLLDVVAEKIRKTLDQFIIMDDCAIADASGTREVVSVFGLEARDVLAKVGLDPGELMPHAFVLRDGVLIVRDTTLGLDAYELHAPAGGGVLERVAAVAPVVSARALDVARIERGVPIDGRDLDEETFPMEARLERALSLTKGCYVGQEVIARATNFGGVRHILVGLILDRAVQEGAALSTESAQTGEITSVAESPALGKAIALGYVRRSEEAPGTRLFAGAERVPATVAVLPFR